MNIRQANQKDASEIALLMNQLGYSASQQLIAEKIDEFYQNNCDAVFVAETDRIIGVISCHIISLFHQAGNCGRITSLCVDESSREIGVGKVLVDAAEKYFKSKNCIRFEVTSGEHRLDAHKFYLACGYKEDERRFIKHKI